MRYRLTFVTGFAAGYVLGARGVAQNAAVRNTVESAGLQSRVVAAKAADRLSTRFGDRLPDAVVSRMRSLRERNRPGGGQDDWGTTTNT